MRNMQDNYLKIEVSDWNTRKKTHICIISIIKKEMSQIVKKFNMKLKNGQYIYWEGAIEGYPDIIIHCYQQNESGNIYSTQLTEYVLQKDYDYYFCIGTAGAVQAKLYDVVIANQVIYLEKGSNTPEGRKYDGKAPEVTEKEKNIINTFVTKLEAENKFEFSVDVAPIYSGENVEKNPKATDLTEAKNFGRHLAAIDMEAYGVFQALHFFESFTERKDKFVTVIRGISDRADMQKGVAYEDGVSSEQRKEKAMENVLTILSEFIVFLRMIECAE